MDYRKTFVFYEGFHKHFERLLRRDRDLALKYLIALMEKGLYEKEPPEDDELWDFGLDADFANITGDRKKREKRIGIPKEELTELLSQGKTNKQISEIYSCSSETIRLRRKEYRLD